LRCLAWALIGLGVLLLSGAVVLAYWRSAAAAQGRAGYLAQVFFPFPSEPLADLPFLTGGRQGLVYAPGQTVLAFASGFKPHEPLFVRLYHRTHGLLDAYATRADARGQIVLARPLSTLDDEEDFSPPGGLWFQVEALSGMEQEYAFRLDPGPAEDAPPTKGVYPPSAVPGSVVVLWCSGMPVGETPQVQASVDGEPLRPQSLRLKLYPVSSDGLLLAALTISLDDPTGQWTIFLDSCQFRFPVQPGEKGSDAAERGQKPKESGSAAYTLSALLPRQFRHPKAKS